MQETNATIVAAGSSEDRVTPTMRQDRCPQLVLGHGITDPHFQGFTVNKKNPDRFTVAQTRINRV